MKNLLLLILLLGFSIISNGKSIDLQTAKKVAKTYLKSHQKEVNTLSLVALEGTSNSSNKTMISSESPLYYVFKTNSDDGFILIAGDDNANPVLGYSTKGNFDQNNLPLNFRKWIEGYKKELNYIIAHNIDATPEIKSKWNALKNGITTYLPKANAVSPLITTTWNQSPHYNALCPGGSVTGCVATAMAQLMYHWKHPVQGSGFHSYNENDYGTLSANFGSTTYQWSAMPTNVTSPNSAVATLMYHCGVSVDMDYSPQVSGAAGAVKVAPALKQYFSYPASTQIADRNNYSEAQWIQLLKGELDAGRPMYYEGIGSGGGHAFVCDGYNNNYFHFNWGWGGQADGYFLVGALNPGSTGTGGGSGGYNASQKVVLGIKSPSGSGGGGGGGTSNYDLRLFNSLNISSSTIQYGQAFAVSTYIGNYGSNTFKGEYTAAVFDKSYNHITNIKTFTNQTLPGGNYSNNLVFNTNGILAMLPGKYYIGVFYKPTGGDWKKVANGNYTNLVQITVKNSNAIELNSAMTIASGNTVVKGKPISVNLNVINNSSSTFIGKYGVGLFNLDGTLAQTIGILNETNGLPPGNTYLSPYLTFSASAVTVDPGTYLLAVQHNPNNTGWQLVGSTNHQNPIFVTVKTPGVQPDKYESNNTVATAFKLPVNFSGNQATVLTTGSNNHTGADYDYYSIQLPVGYDYTITPRVHDQHNSGNGQTYTNDVLWSYSTGGQGSKAYDDVMPTSIKIWNGGTIKFLVAPYFQGKTGTYLLDVKISRVPSTGIEDIGLTNEYNVFPNPVTNTLTLTTPNRTDLQQITIHDILGKKVREISTFSNSENISIPVEDLSQGTYLLLIRANNKVWQRKFIKH